MQGQIICIRWLIKDISERKQAEAALQQQARQQQLLLNITQAIRQTLDLNAILNTTVTEVRVIEIRDLRQEAGQVPTHA